MKIKFRMMSGAMLMASLLLLDPVGLNASLLVEGGLPTTGSNGNNLVAFGQSVTTPSGGPWGEIRFHFFDINQNPAALGTLYVLSQAYVGAFASLSNATPGYLASTSTIVNGVWEFGALALQPSTQYFFLMGGASGPFWTFSTLNPYAGGIMYAGPLTLIPDPSQDMAFRLYGTALEDPARVPEPGSFGLAAVVLAGLMLRSRR